jgi:hypothetical protein
MGRGTLEAAPATGGGCHHPKRKSIPENSIIPLGSLGLGGGALLYAGEKLGVGGILWGRRPPSAGGGPMLGRRPAPFGRWPPPKKKVYNGK